MVLGNDGDQLLSGDRQDVQAGGGWTGAPQNCRVGPALDDVAGRLDLDQERHHQADVGVDGLEALQQRLDDVLGVEHAAQRQRALDMTGGLAGGRDGGHGVMGVVGNEGQLLLLGPLPDGLGRAGTGRLRMSPHVARDVSVDRPGRP